MRKRILSTLLAAVLLLGTVANAIPAARAQSDLHTSQTLVDLLISFEGFTGKCIVDNTQRSVGYGTRCDVCDPNMPGYLDPNRECAAYTAANPITEEHAMELKMNFLAYFEGLLNNFANKYGITFTQNQFDALISLTYNCGQGWMSDSEGILRDAVVSRDMGDYLVYAFGLYSKSGKTVSLGHVKRRMVEAEVYLHGNYENDWPENLRYVLLDGNGGELRYYYQTFDAAELCPIRAQITAPARDEGGNALTFAGWFTQPVGGKEVKNLSAALTNGMVLYAQWKNAAGETVTVNTDTSTAVDVTVIVPQWWPNTLYEGPGKYYSEVRKTTFNEQLHITKTVVGKDGDNWGCCADGWIPLSHTNYTSVAPAPTPDGTWYTITASAVNVRTGPDVINGTVGSKANGTQVLIVATQENPEDDQTWGKLADGNWICIRNGAEPVYAVVTDPQPTTPPPTSSPVSGVTVQEMRIAALPAVREYLVGGLDVLPDLTGAEIAIVYSNGIRKTLPITRHMVSGFDNSRIGTVTVTVTCGGKTASFEVQIISNVVTGIAMQSPPAKTEYQFGKETLDLSGAALAVTYEGNKTRVVPITADMVSGFRNTVPGKQTLTVSYGGFTTSFDVTVVEHVVTFVNYDGTVLSQNRYNLGDPVAVPPNPTRPEDDQGIYEFAGWDKEVVSCQGSVTYTATYTRKDPVGTGVVTFVNFDGTVLSQNRYVLGAAVTAPADPTRPNDDTGEYVFAGWDKEVVSCQGSTTYKATYTLYHRVIFLNYDGTVLSSQQYLPGAAVAAPANPEKPADQVGEYVFSGWDREVTACSGNAAYTATYRLRYGVGDLDRNNTLDSDDAIYLLRHVLFPEKYPVYAWADYNGDGTVNSDDAIYLLRHVLFPEKYPLHTP